MSLVLVQGLLSLIVKTKPRANGGEGEQQQHHEMEHEQPEAPKRRTKMIQSKTMRGMGVPFLALIGNLLLAAPLLATSYTYDFGGGGGELGVSSFIFSSTPAGGPSITAYGLKLTSATSTSPTSTNGTPVNLYQKNAGAGETGLGISTLATGDSDGEIQTLVTAHDAQGNPTQYTNWFVQLDLTPLFSAGGNIQLAVVESVQTGELYQFWASANATQLGSMDSLSGVSCDSNGVCTGNISLSASTPYLSLTSPYTTNSGDVLLGSISTTIDRLNAIPEPSTWLLLGSGLVGLILWRKRTA